MAGRLLFQCARFAIVSMAGRLLFQCARFAIVLKTCPESFHPVTLA
jgi:hypothetical protein